LKLYNWMMLTFCKNSRTYTATSFTVTFATYRLESRWNCHILRSVQFIILRCCAKHLKIFTLSVGTSLRCAWLPIPFKFRDGNDLISFMRTILRIPSAAGQCHDVPLSTRVDSSHHIYHRSMLICFISSPPPPPPAPAPPHPRGEGETWEINRFWKDFGRGFPIISGKKRKKKERKIDSGTSLSSGSEDCPIDDLRGVKRRVQWKRNLNWPGDTAVISRFRDNQAGKHFPNMLLSRIDRAFDAHFTSAWKRIFILN